MSVKKSAWHKPQLIVVVRNKPEEAVLMACKGPSGQTQGPTCPSSCKSGPTYCSVRVDS